MRPKYQTRAIVLARRSLGEANLLLTLATEEVGLVEARAQSVRKQGAKQAAALKTFAQTSVLLVRGAEGWRVAGAVLEEDWYGTLSHEARKSMGRVVGLMLRLTSSEAHERQFYPILQDFFNMLTAGAGAEADSAEILAALRILAALGLDAGDIPEGEGLAAIRANRSEYVRRVNRGIEASGL